MRLIHIYVLWHNTFIWYTHTHTCTCAFDCCRTSMPVFTHWGPQLTISSTGKHVWMQPMPWPPVSSLTQPVAHMYLHKYMCASSWVASRWGPTQPPSICNWWVGASPWRPQTIPKAPMPSTRLYGFAPTTHYLYDFAITSKPLHWHTSEWVSRRTYAYAPTTIKCWPVCAIPSDPLSHPLMRTHKYT